MPATNVAGREEETSKPVLCVSESVSVTVCAIFVEIFTVPTPFTILTNPPPVTLVPDATSVTPPPYVAASWLLLSCAWTVTVRGTPTTPLPGSRITNFAAASRTVNVWALEVPPPGAGFTTVTADVVAVVRSDVRIAAVSVVIETNVVVRAEPSHRTEEEALKFVPVSVSVKPLLPAVVEVGEMLVVVGTGFETATVLLNTEVTPAEVAQIFMLSPKEYCIAVYASTPFVTAAPLAGVEDNVPFPAVPPQIWAERTGAKLIVDALSEVFVFPY